MSNISYIKYYAKITVKFLFSPFCTKPDITPFRHWDSVFGRASRFHSIYWFSLVTMADIPKMLNSFYLLVTLVSMANILKMLNSFYLLFSLVTMANILKMLNSLILFIVFPSNHGKRSTNAKFILFIVFPSNHGKLSKNAKFILSIVYPSYHGKYSKNAKFILLSVWILTATWLQVKLFSTGVSTNFHQVSNL